MLAMLDRHAHRAADETAALVGMLAPNGLDALTVPELEELLVAVNDRADVVAPDRAPVLDRGRRALEVELATRLRA